MRSRCNRLLVSVVTVAVVLSLFMSGFECLTKLHNDLILLPINPEVEDGNVLTLNCTILPEYAGTYTNRDLFFSHGSVNLTNVTLVGSKTALLSSRWVLEDGGISGGHVRCKLPDRLSEFGAMQSVTVVRRPAQPSVTACFLENWKHLNCTWQPSSGDQQQHMHTHTPLIQTLQWKLGGGWNNAVCKGEVTDSCVWNVSHTVDLFIESKSCCVRVFARIHLNHLHFEVVSEQFCFRPADCVVLDRPRNVTSRSTAVHQTFVEWQAPMLDTNHVSSMALMYAVTVLSQWSEALVINQSFYNHSMSFASIPYTAYAVTVTVKTLESRFWSKPASRNFTTAPDVPKMSPPTLKNAFMLGHVDRTIRTVTVYWQTLSKREYHASWLNYVILMRKSAAFHWNERFVITPPAQSCKDVDVDIEYVELAVIARNEIGDTAPDVVMHIPAVQSLRVPTSPFSEFVVELVDNSTVAWTWTLKSSEASDNLTLFWCRSHFPHCRCVSDFSWLDVPTSRSGHNLTIGANNADEYCYGAALKTDSSGIEWATCLYNRSGLAEPVRNLRLSVSHNPGQLLATWVLPSCDVRLGHIQTLVLYYCRHTSTGCVDEHSQVSLPGYTTLCKLTELESGAEYAVWLYSWTRAGPSANHSSVVVAVTSPSFMTAAVIAGLVVAAVLVLLLTPAFVWMLCKYCRRCHAKLFPPLPITVPPAVTHPTATTSMSTPWVEYTRTSIDRQISRLSGSSNGSGQLGVASSSPLLSARSCSESVVSPPMTPLNNADCSQPMATKYVNDNVLYLPHSVGNNHHSSSSPGRAECIPLQPMGETVAADEDEDTEDAGIVPGNKQPNGGYHSIALHPDTGYVLHEWMQKL